MSEIGSTPWSDSSMASQILFTTQSMQVAQPTSTLPSRRLGIAPSTTFRSAPMQTMRYASVHVNGCNPVSLSIIGVKTPGDHNYQRIPFDLLKDQTDKGPLWDVTKNYRGFWYDPPNGVVSHSPGAGIGGSVQLLEGSRWLNFSGFWGDKKWPTSRFGQYCVGNECLIGDGPTGKHSSPVPGFHRVIASD